MVSCPATRRKKSAPTTSSGVRPPARRVAASPGPSAANAFSTAWKRPTTAARWRCRSPDTGAQNSSSAARVNSLTTANPPPGVDQPGQHQQRQVGRQVRVKVDGPAPVQNPAQPRHPRVHDAGQPRPLLGDPRRVQRLGDGRPDRGVREAAVVGERGREAEPVGGEDPQRADRHRGDRVERVVRAERVRIGEHRPHLRVPGDHDVPYPERIGHRGRQAVGLPRAEQQRHGMRHTAVRLTATLSSASGTGTSYSAAIVHAPAGRNARPGSPTSTEAPARRGPPEEPDHPVGEALAVEHVAGEHDLGVAVVAVEQVGPLGGHATPRWPARSARPPPRPAGRCRRPAPRRRRPARPRSRRARSRRRGRAPASRPPPPGCPGRTGPAPARRPRRTPRTAVAARCGTRPRSAPTARSARRPGAAGSPAPAAPGPAGRAA